MESAAKRRKIGHSSGALPLQYASLYSSAGSAFAAATDDLLRDTALDYGRIFGGANEMVRQFRSTIESIEPKYASPLGEATAALERDHKIGIPYPAPRPARDSAYKLSFSKPTEMKIVGSYPFQTMIKPQTDCSIDLVVVMPKDLFQEKDYANYRYFYRRAYYLACLAAELCQAHDDTMDFVWDYLHGNPLTPILVARPKQQHKRGGEKDAQARRKTSYGIRIIPCAPDGLFPPKKLLPTKNNIISTEGLSRESSLHGTTYSISSYNNALKAESSYSSYHQLIENAKKSFTAYKDTLVLGRIWLHQRGFGGDISRGGFGHFEWAVLVALLLQTGGRKGEPLISPSLSSSQMFKAVIRYLADSSLQKKPNVLGTKPNSEAVKQTGPILYDSGRGLNIAWKMTAWSADLLSQQAKWSQAALDLDLMNQFDALFITKIEQPLQVFDLSVDVTLPSDVEKQSREDPWGQAYDFSRRLYQVVNKSLGDRAQLISIRMPSSPSWPTSSGNPKSSPGNPVVGIMLSPANANRRMDRGPAHDEQKEAAKYHEFWGDKAELRRFQDGSIFESIIWDVDSSMSIPEQIIRYSTQRHLSVAHDELAFRGNDMKTVAKITSEDHQAFYAAHRAFETLERDIRALEDLPLHVRQVMGICPELRWASLRPPAAKRPIMPMDVVLSFEASGKWTDNLAAKQRLKVAFLLKLGSSLEASSDGVKTHLGLENTDQEAQNLAFLDIVYETSFAFRLRIQSEAEEAELDGKLKNKALDPQTRAQLTRLRNTCKRLYTNLPLHNQTISTVATRFPPLSDSIRLVKQWFSSHKLTYHFNEELVELFVLHAFLNPYPWPEPSSALTGFFRTMHVLSRWQWHEEPLIIEHSSESLSSQTREEILAQYRAYRTQDPGMEKHVLIVATSHDTTGLAYTDSGPSRVVANQMTKLARSVCELAKSKGVELDIKSLFHTASLKHYDFTITLNKNVVKAIIRDDGAKTSQFKNLEELAYKNAVPLARHPVLVFVEMLKETYGDAAVFFHGGQEDLVVTGLWKPGLEKRVLEVRGRMSCAFRPSDGGKKLEVDRIAMLAEMARLGGDLVERVEVVSK